MAAHHLRRAGARQEVEAFGGLFLRGCCPRCGCRSRGQGGRPGARGGLVLRGVRRGDWASRNPERPLGVVLVDGAYPYDWLDEAMEQRIRKLFKRMSLFTPLLRPLGLTPRMTAEEQAESNIEMGMISRTRELGPVLDNITVPARYIVASGASFGSHGDEQERIRTGLDAVLARNPNIRISAKVASNHDAILKKDAPAVARVVREVAALDRGRVRKR